MPIRTPEGGGYGGSLPYQPRADRLDIRSLTEGYQRRIGRVVGGHGATVHALIDELDSGLDTAIRLQTNHEPGLIVERPVLPGKRHFNRQIADGRAVREMTVVANEAIFRLAPEIRPVVRGDDQVAVEAPPMRRRIQPHEGVLHATDTTRSRSSVHPSRCYDVRSAHGALTSLPGASDVPCSGAQRQGDPGATAVEPEIRDATTHILGGAHRPGIHPFLKRIGGRVTADSAGRVVWRQPLGRGNLLVSLHHQSRPHVRSASRLALRPNAVSEPTSGPIPGGLPGPPR